MRFCAIDMQSDGFNDEFVGLAYRSDQSGGWVQSEPDALAIIKNHAEQGYTFAAHNAEYQCASLLLRKNIYFRAQYVNERWNHGEYHYDVDKRPAMIWDAWSLAGGLALPDLAEAMGKDWLSCPARLIRPAKEVPIGRCFTHDVLGCTWCGWRGDPTDWQCFDHGRWNCPSCVIEQNRWEWICEKHGRGECLECWQTQVVELVWLYMADYQGFLEPYGIKPKRRLSSASTALWRKLDNPEPCWLRDKKTDEISRLGYAGGRVEAIKLGKLGELFTADFDMMYPSIMSTVPMPDPAHTEFNESRFLDDSWIKYEGVTEATVTVQPCYLPVLPVRSDGQLLFPVGTFRSVFTNVELRAAIQRGATIETVHRVVYSPQTVEPFSNFTLGLMDYRLQLERQGNPKALVIKMLLNQLSGHFGMRTEIVRMNVMPLPPGMKLADWSKWDARLTQHGWLLRKEQWNTIRDKWANPLWAAMITGHARIRLLEAMEAQGANLAYVDTDSLFSTAPIVGMGEGPGSYSDRGTYQECCIYGPKLYTLETGDRPDRIRAAGVPRRSAKEFLKTWEATWTQRTGLNEAWTVKSEPGALQMIRANRRLEFGKRHVDNLAHIMMGIGWSDTTAQQMMVDGEALESPTPI